MVSDAFIFRYDDYKYTGWLWHGENGEIKTYILPRVVMADDFESEWNTYMKAMTFPVHRISSMRQVELDRRMEKQLNLNRI